jgi:hypothetical protein
VPELRSEALTARLFLGRRSVLGWAALAGLVAGRRNRAAYLLTAPYLADLARTAGAARDPVKVAAVAAGHLVSDATRQAALVWGSIRYRSPVL